MPRPYKSTDRKDRTPQVLIARGELSIDDKHLLSRLLGRFGLSTEYATQADYDERERHLAAAILGTSPETKEARFSFASITSPNDFLVREHLRQLQERATTFDAGTSLRVSQGFVGRLFNYLVDVNGPSRSGEWSKDPDTNQRQWVSREPQPLDGIVIANRIDVGFPPYEPQTDFRSKNGLCAQYAVQAGSIVAASEHLGAQSNNPQGPKDTIHNLRLVALLLERQFT